MSHPRIEVKLDLADFNATFDKVRTAFEKFAERVLANPEARAAFYRAQRAHPPRLPGGAYYRARSRRRTRRNR